MADTMSIVRRRSLGSRLRDRRVSGWLFMLPLILINLVVVAVPSLLSVWYSFTDWTGISTRANFIGLQNYATLIADPEFLNGLVHNLLWTVFFLIVPMAMGPPVPAAVPDALLHPIHRGQCGECLDLAEHPRSRHRDRQLAGHQPARQS
jgi:ABC-type polysaccharide transport system permease subunit